MNVLHVIPGLRAGGAESLLYYLVRDWKRYARHSEASIMTLMSGGVFYERCLEEGLPVTTLGFAGIRDVQLGRGVPEFVRRLRAGRYDVVHCHLTWADFYSVIGVPLSRSGAAVVYTEHNVWNRRRRLWFRPVDWAVSRRFDATIAVSELAGARYLQWNGLAPPDVTVVHNGIPVDRFQVGPRTGCKLIHIGRFDPVKDHRTLFDACKQLMDGGVPFELWLVGDGVLRAQMELRVAELGLTPMVRFLGVRRDIPELLRQCDIFVLPSRWEGLPVSMLEAMASGLPVVATKVGGIPEAVTSGTEGMLVAPEHPVALADALRKYLDDPEARRAAGDRARSRVEADFSMGPMIERLERVYLDARKRV